MKKTKIIATIGPACENEKSITKLIIDGVNAFRLNFSHGNHIWHKEIIFKIRKISKQIELPVSIIADLQGPKLRTGTLKNSRPVMLKKNQKFTITTKTLQGSKDKVSTTYKYLPMDVKRGDTILINDGQLSLKVLNKNKTDVVCKVIVGGELREHKGINLPGLKCKTPSLTKKDKKDLKLAISTGNIDFFALSFVRSSDDVKAIKTFLKEQKSLVPVIAKIEKPQAIENIDSILSIADGIMVARGDLGVEMNLEEVPPVQKFLIEKAAMKHKTVITATQMLESMISSPVPTRAEASDVSNAIMDGSDAIMLSGETAVGLYPLKTVQTMVKITKAAESSSYMKYFANMYDPEKINIELATASAACSAIYESKASAIMLFTLTGGTARIVSKLRPSVPILALTPSEKTFNKLSLYWGTIPILTRMFQSNTKMLKDGVKIIIDKKLVKKEDNIIVLIGDSEKTRNGSTNVMKIITI